MAGLDAYGTQLQRGDGGGPEVFTPIARVSKIEGPGRERETYDTTTHDDGEDAHRTFVGGLKDGGEVELELMYSPQHHDALLEDFDDSEPRNYKMVFPDATSATWSFAALLTKFKPSAPVDDKLTASATFKVSGKPVIS